MVEIRPLDFGEVLDGALTLYRRNFGLFFRLAVATLWLPIAAVIYFQTRMQGLQPDQVAGLMQGHIGAFVGYAVLFAIVYLIGFLLLTAASIQVISASYLGKATGLGASLSLAFSRLFALIGVGFGKAMLLFMAWVGGALGIGAIIAVGRLAGGVALGFVMTFVSFVALVWGIIYLYCAYGLTTEIVVLEKLEGAFDAFGRSWMLTKGSRFKVFGLAFVSYLIVNVVPGITLAVLSGLTQASVPAAMPAIYVVNALITLALAPIIPCVFTLLYYDLRARREGFDIEHVGQQLGLT
jgi:hypothetical protein